MSARNLQRAVLAAVCFVLLWGGGVCAGQFVLYSKDLGTQLTLSQVFSRCGGQNISPSLTWENAPAGTRSFAVTLYDPDARGGRGWWHWLMVNIPAETTGLPADAGNPEKQLAPAGSLQLESDFHLSGFGGACPPVGDKPHHYIFTVYALDVATLPISAQTPPAEVAALLKKRAMATSSITSLYQR